MVSRRKILSRSRDDLNLDQAYMPMDDEEDIWYQKEKLFKVSDILMRLFSAVCVEHVLYLQNIIMTEAFHSQKFNERNFTVEIVERVALWDVVMMTFRDFLHFWKFFLLD